MTLMVSSTSTVLSLLGLFFAASGTLVRVNGVGAAAGPLLAALMTASVLGVAAFYLLLAVGTALLATVSALLLARTVEG